ncbi:MAG TPA: VIT domain-containing protein, partial [Planctomycetota bacterium]|nr:VIT domain-containing protein [Planctomycetota bacterium]
ARGGALRPLLALAASIVVIAGFAARFGGPEGSVVLEQEDRLESRIDAPSQQLTTSKVFFRRAADADAAPQVTLADGEELLVLSTPEPLAVYNWNIVSGALVTGQGGPTPQGKDTWAGLPIAGKPALVAGSAFKLSAGGGAAARAATANPDGTPISAFFQPVTGTASPAPAEPAPPEDLGTGELLLRNADGSTGAAFPLEHTDVRAEVTGFLASTVVEQRFANPFDRKIEAVYCFPLPHSAAVNEFVMEIGARRIRGIVREREEARRVYEAARAAGQVATLLEEERPNVFVQSVANLEPAQRISVKIRYFHALPCEDGRFSYVFPMVVGHRYGSEARAPGHDAVTPPRLADGTRSGHEVSFALSIDAGVPIAEVRSPSHDVTIERPAPERALVRLSEADAIADRDLVVEFALGAKREAAFGLLAHAGADGRFFTLLAAPPLAPADADVVPRELCFVLDVSGSMEGHPIAASKRFIAEALGRLRPDDTFDVATFAGDAKLMSEDFLAATPANVADARRWVEALGAGGGTEMEKGIRLALEHPRDPKRVRIVVFLTDGGVSFEGDIFERIKASRGEARIFCLGANAAPNRWLLDGMARLGRGAAEYVGPDEPDEAVARKVDALYRRLDAPVLVDVRVDWGGLDVADVGPRDLPDLFAAGAPLELHGRYGRAGRGVVTISGRCGARTVERRLEVTLPDAEPAHAALGPIWARSRIAELEERLAGASPEGAADLAREVRKLALDFSLASPFTSFVAVDESTQTGAGGAARVEQPVEVPRGVDPKSFGTGKKCD